MPAMDPTLPDYATAKFGPQRRRLDHALEHLRHGVRWGLPDLAELERRWAAVAIAMEELRQAVQAKEASK